MKQFTIRKLQPDSKLHSGPRVQSGQAMVEYVVVLMVLTAVLLTANYTASDGSNMPDGYIGTSEADQGSLVQAINMKHRGHNYALSLSEIPETDDWTALADYYDSLNKYPELSPQIRSGAQAMGQITNGLNQITSGVSQVGQYIPPKFPPSGFPPSFPPSGFPF